MMKNSKSYHDRWIPGKIGLHRLDVINSDVDWALTLAHNDDGIRLFELG